MPQQTAYTLKWCEENQVYDVFTEQGNETLGVVPEGPAWQTWLHSISSFAFHGKTGLYTARKERGEDDWYAYVRSKGKVTRRHLGASSSLTLAHLEQMEHELATSQQTEERHEKTVPGSASSIPPSGRGTPRTASTKGTSRATVQSLPTPLIMTKVQAPRLRSALVHRSRLIHRLQEGMEGPLTLISAPAGFGKTTLLTSWLTSNRTPTAWFSVESEDNDPVRFVTYLLAALRRLDRQLGQAFYLSCSPGNRSRWKRYLPS